MMPPGLLVAADRTSDRVFLLALVAAAGLHLGLIMLVEIAPPLQERPAVASGVLEVMLLRGEGPQGDAAASAALSETTSPARDEESVAPAGQGSLATVPASAEQELVPETGTHDQTEPMAATLDASSPRREDIAPTTDEVRPAELAESSEPHSLESAPGQTPTHQALQPVDPIPGHLQWPSPETNLESSTEPAPDPGRAKLDAARILASRGAEIDRLSATPGSRVDDLTGGVRRKSLGAATSEFRYASYLNAWASKVQRIGNLNYPQAAKEQRLYGSLVLHVAVRADGTVEQIRILRSSGYPLLDEAAIRIVELAAPFAPFPPDIAAETDVLDIVRHWQFLRGGRLGWEPSG
jgi:protein TonB